MTQAVLYPNFQRGRACATWSPDRVYRYTLHRDFSPGLPLVREVAFLMLNPSTADERTDDPTIRRCMGFAKRWGFDQLTILNVYALRSTDPRGLWQVSDPVGPGNDVAITEALARVEIVICAWGVHAKADRLRQVADLFTPHKAAVFCLGLTKDGAPRHPLYLRGDTIPTPFDPATTL